MNPDLYFLTGKAETGLITKVELCQTKAWAGKSLPDAEEVQQQLRLPVQSIHTAGTRADFENRPHNGRGNAALCSTDLFV